MVAAMILTSGFEHRLAALGTSAPAKLMLGRAGLALPYIAAAAIGVVALFAANGSTNIKAAGLSVLAGSAVVIIVAIAREAIRLAAIAGNVPAGQSVLAYADPATLIGAGIMFIGSVFALRVAIEGNAALAMAAPKRIGGRRAVHGEAYGGRDATSKWFESASWISFAAINDPETAEYISKRCGDTTVEVDQTNRSSE